MENLKTMNSEEDINKALGICRFVFSRLPNNKLDKMFECSCLMAKYKDEQYKPLIDLILSIRDNFDFEGAICSDIHESDNEWCKENCTQEKPNCECIIKWLTTKNK